MRPFFYLIDVIFVFLILDLLNITMKGKNYEDIRQSRKAILELFLC
jgi:hypothetical protein